ncbi:hypothetical protein EDC04DRAFT_2907072 [Pisolithus marmoratus]|nr:hypothetical protein EDC04DRAFT_2907072 [Pisolithus marmoratus]
MSTDIHHRLSMFSSVKSLDGFSKLDTLGDPRPFTYATLEGKEKDLTRCMNVPSGPTWKGTKLHIGEEKPDYCQWYALPPSVYLFFLTLHSALII